MHESGVTLLSLVQSTSSHLSQHLSVRDDGLNGSPRHLFMSAITQGIGSDGRHSSHSRLLPVNTGWVFKVVSDRTFSNSALTHPASHLAAVGLGSLFVFDVPLWMQIFSNNGWTAEAGASHMHAPSPSPRHCFGLLFYVIASPESGGKKTTQEKISSCVFSVSIRTPRVKWVRSHVGTFLKNTVFTCSILVTNTRHTREAYPPWSGMAGREERGLPAHAITGQWSNTLG